MKKPRTKTKPASLPRSGKNFGKKIDEEEINPHHLHNRALRRVAKLLDRLDKGKEMPIREELAVTLNIWRGLQVDLQLRRHMKEDASAGSAVRRYSTEFEKKPDAAGRGAADTGPAGHVPADYERFLDEHPEPDDDTELDDELDHHAAAE
jgi:hypothetical protein